MEKTGQLLKAARENQSLSISEVALATKINARILQAIEEGRVDELPPKSFLRGFVQSYAKYLKMDLNIVLSSFQDEMGVTTPQPEENPSETSAKWPKKVPFLTESSITSKTLAVVGILILIGLIIGLKNIIEKYERERIVGEPPENVISLQQPDEGKGGDSAAPSPEAQSTSQEKLSSVTEETAVQPTPTAAKHDSKVPAKKQAANVDSPEEKKEVQAEASTPTKPEAAKTVTPPVAAKTAPKAPAPASTTPPVSKETESSKPTSPPKTQRQEIIVEALDRVTISFRIDGGEVQKITLQPEQIHTIKAQSGVSLDLADGGAVNIIHNGRDRGVPGDLGKPIKVKFP